MTIENMAAFLGWCTVINGVVLAIWLMMVTLARGLIFKLHSCMFTLSESQFNALHYGGMGLYKLMIFMFNLAPYIALRLIM